MSAQGNMQEGRWSMSQMMKAGKAICVFSHTLSDKAQKMWPKFLSGIFDIVNNIQVSDQWTHLIEQGKIQFGVPETSQWVRAITVMYN